MPILYLSKIIFQRYNQTIRSWDITVNIYVDGLESLELGELFLYLIQYIPRLSQVILLFLGQLHIHLACTMLQLNIIFLLEEVG